METQIKKERNLDIIKKIKMVSPPPGVKCARPGNSSCAHPTTCAKSGRCYYDK